TGSSTVRSLLVNPQVVLRSGGTGVIVMPSNRESAIVIPQKATFELQDKKFVYIVNDSNKVVSTPIIIDPINDGKTFVVTSGLKAGDRIAVEGVGTRLSDGLTISPVDPSQMPAQAPQGAAAPQQQK
ncbi:MAG: efflux RND transporter periplasmic adaptor subunit, partial [Duncaniella sp.]|nr:efflux RND transporter periplasmic adaptor subunit [Duncaniella sp.]